MIITIADIQKDLTTYGGATRDRILSALLTKLTPLSRSSLLSFEGNWDMSKPFDEFKVAQNKEILGLIELEMGILGCMVRSNLDFPELRSTDVVTGVEL